MPDMPGDDLENASAPLIAVEPYAGDIETWKPEPCLGCGSALPLTMTPRNELYFYTAGVSRLGLRMETDVTQEPRGRLCDVCTQRFVEWLKEP